MLRYAKPFNPSYVDIVRIAKHLSVSATMQQKPGSRTWNRHLHKTSRDIISSINFRHREDTKV